MNTNYEKILNKILNHDYVFNDLERDYILLHPTLKETFISEMNKDNFVLNKDNINIVLEFAEEGTINLAYKVCKYLIETDDPMAFHIIYNIKCDISSESARANITNMLNNEVKINENSLIFVFEEIQYLIVNKRFDEVIKIRSQVILDDNELNFLKENFPLEQYGIPFCFSENIEALYDYLKYSSLKILMTAYDIIERSQELIPDYKSKLDYIKTLIVEKRNEVDKSLDRYELNNFYLLLKDISNPNTNTINKLSGEEFLNTIKLYEENNIFFPGHRYQADDIENKLEQILNNKINNINTDSFFYTVFNLNEKYGQVLYTYKEQLYDYLLNNNLMDEFLDSISRKNLGGNTAEEIKEFYNYIINGLISNLDDERVSSVLNQHMMNISKDKLLSNSTNRLLFQKMIEKEKLECLPYNAVFNDLSDEENQEIHYLRELSHTYLKNHKSVHVLTNDDYKHLRDVDLKDIIYNIDNPMSLCDGDIRSLFRMSCKDAQLKEGIINKIKNNDDFALMFCSRTAFNVVDQDKNKEIFTALASKGGLYLSYFLHNIRNRDCDFLFTKELYDNVKNDICTELGYDVNNLDLMANKLSYKIFKYLNEPSIQKLLKYDINKLDKVLNILSVKSFDQHNLEAIYESIKQYEFEVNNPDKTNIFTNLKHSLADRNILQISQIVSDLTSTFNNKLVYKLNELYNANLKSSEKEEARAFLTKNVEQILSNPQYKHSLDILHEVCNHYVMIKKEENAKTFNIEKEIDIDYVYDKKKAGEFVALEFVENSENFKKCNPLLFEFIYDVHKKLLSKLIEKNNITDSDVLNYDISKVIKYFTSSDKEEYRKKEPNIFDYIRISKHTIANLVESNFLDQFYEMQNTSLDEIVNELLKMPRENENKVKVRQYRSFPEKKVNLYDILINLKESNLDYIISNEEVYNSLISSLNKWSLLDLPEGVCNYIKEKNICEFIDEYSLASFINYYRHFYEKEISKNVGADGKSSNISVIKVLKNIDAYSAVSSVYSQVLGKDDFRYIYTDDQPNRSGYSKAERLDRSLKATCDIFNRKYVTIPTFDEEISYGDARLRVVVGNFTDPTNLSHGERTGACMRIGGAGYSLYNFALENPNGFHIRFEDPDTGKYISRVTGFRNGNTVFLNELRFSLDEKYTSQDIFQICQQTAKRIIELSKGSSAPIENVIIHDDYVVKDNKQKSVYLNIESPSKGYTNLYHDIENIDVVLATTATDKDFVPIDFDNQNVPMYDVQRGKVEESTNVQDLMNRIIRVHAVKQLLKNFEPESVKPIDFEKGFIYGMANDDWYIYVDGNKELHFECVDNNERAKEEFEKAMDYFMNKYNNVFVDKVGDFDRD